MASKLRLKKLSAEQSPTEVERDQIVTLKLWNNIDRHSRNLCFVNSALQLLHHISEFRNYFKDLDITDSDLREMPVCKEICRLFQSAGKSVESSAQLRKLVGRCSGRPDISDGSQQDLSLIHI